MAFGLLLLFPSLFFFFFFNDTATTEIYTLSLHDALPIQPSVRNASWATSGFGSFRAVTRANNAALARSEEHTSELQSHSDLVCRLLLEKKIRSRASWPRRSASALLAFWRAAVISRCRPVMSAALAPAERASATPPS